MPPRGHGPNAWLVAIVVTLAAVHGDAGHHDPQRRPARISRRRACRPAHNEVTWAPDILPRGQRHRRLDDLGLDGPALIGRKRYFLICIAMFTVCSFLCGSPPADAPDGGLPAAAGLVRRRAAAGRSSRSSSTRSRQRNAAKAFAADVAIAADSGRRCSRAGRWAA